MKEFEIPVNFYYYVKVNRKAKIKANSKEEAIKKLKEEIERGADPDNYEYVDECWQYNDYFIP